MLLAALLAVAACGGRPTSVPGPIRHHRAVAPSTYVHYIRGRFAVYQKDYATAIREFDLARRDAPEEPELTQALIEALLLQLTRN